MFVLLFFFFIRCLSAAARGPRTVRTNIMHGEITVIKYCPVVIFQCFIIIIITSSFRGEISAKKTYQK